MAGIGYTIGNLLVKGLAFLTIPIFSRLMSTADYGIYNTFMAYSSILTIIVGLALHSSVKNAKYDFKGRLAEYSSSVVLLIIFNAVLLLALAICFSSWLSEWTGLNALILALLVAESFGNAILTFYNSKLALDYVYKEYLCLAGFHAVASVVLSLIFIWLLPDGKAYAGRIFGAVIPLLLISAYIMIRLFRSARPKVSPLYWKYGCKISLPLIPHGLSQIALSQFDRIMINNTLGPSDAGLYSFAYNIGIILQVISSSLDSVWTPWFFEQYSRGDLEKIRKTSAGYVLIFASITVLVLLVSPEMIMILGSREYWPSREVVVPIVLSMFFAFMYTLPSIVEYFYKRTQLISLGTVCAAVLNIILNFIFIPMYGYTAAAYTTLVCYLLYFIFHILIARKIAGYHVYNIRMLAGVCAAVCIFGAFALIFLDNMIVRLVMFAVVFAAVCIVLYRNRRAILELIRKK